MQRAEITRKQVGRKRKSEIKTWCATHKTFSLCHKRLEINSKQADPPAKSQIMRTQKTRSTQQEEMTLNLPLEKALSALVSFAFSSCQQFMQKRRSRERVPKQPVACKCKMETNSKWANIIELTANMKSCVHFVPFWIEHANCYMFSFKRGTDKLMNHTDCPQCKITKTWGQKVFSFWICRSRWDFGTFGKGWFNFVLQASR